MLSEKCIEYVQEHRLNCLRIFSLVSIECGVSDRLILCTVAVSFTLKRAVDWLIPSVQADMDFSEVLLIVFSDTTKVKVLDPKFVFNSLPDIICVVHGIVVGENVSLCEDGVDAVLGTNFDDLMDPVLLDTKLSRLDLCVGIEWVSWFLAWLVSVSSAPASVEFQEGLNDSLLLMVGLNVIFPASSVLGPLMAQELIAWTVEA